MPKRHRAPGGERGQDRGQDRGGAAGPRAARGRICHPGIISTIWRKRCPGSARLRVPMGKPLQGARVAVRHSRQGRRASAACALREGGGPGARGAHFDGSEVTGRGLLARSSHKLPAPLTACCPPASPTLPASARNPSLPAPCAPGTSGCARSGLEVHAQGRCALHRCWALPRGTHSGAWLHLCGRPRADNAGFAVCGGFGLSGFLLRCQCGSGMR